MATLKIQGNIIQRNQQAGIEKYSLNSFTNSILRLIFATPISSFLPAVALAKAGKWICLR
jgi:hypothetical protein